MLPPKFVLNRALVLVALLMILLFIGRREPCKLTCNKDTWVGDSFRVCNHASFYNRFKSQGSQDLYLYHIFNKIGTTNRFFVEFGFNEPSYTSGGSGANTWNLYDLGWRGLLLDGKHNNETINLHAHFLFANNVADVFRMYKVPHNFDFLSVDMDSHDLFVFEAILKEGYRPRVITTEFNSNYPLELDITLIDPTITNKIKREKTFKFKQCAWGASASALRLVAERYGYSLIGRVGVLDLIWIQNSLLQVNWELPPFESFFEGTLHTKYKKLGQLHHKRQTDPSIFKRLMDYRTFMETGDVDAAVKAAEVKIKSLDLECFELVTK